MIRKLPRVTEADQKAQKKEKRSPVKANVTQPQSQSAKTITNTNTFINNTSDEALSREVERLRERLALLETKNVLPVPSGEGVYIVRTRHVLDTRQLIYKCGFSLDMKTRLRQYPKGSQLLFFICADNARQLEARIHNTLREDSAVKQRKDFGSEYYEAKLEDLIDVMLECRAKHIANDI